MSPKREAKPALDEKKLMGVDPDELKDPFAKAQPGGKGSTASLEPTYHKLTPWNGLDNFGCGFCKFSTLDENQMVEHLNRLHHAAAIRKADAGAGEVPTGDVTPTKDKEDADG